MVNISSPNPLWVMSCICIHIHTLLCAYQSNHVNMECCSLFCVSSFLMCCFHHFYLAHGLDPKPGRPTSPTLFTEIDAQKVPLNNSSIGTKGTFNLRGSGLVMQVIQKHFNCMFQFLVQSHLWWVNSIDLQKMPANLTGLYFCTQTQCLYCIRESFSHLVEYGDFSWVQDYVTTVENFIRSVYYLID